MHHKYGFSLLPASYLSVMRFPSLSRERVITIGVLEPLMFSTENGLTVTRVTLRRRRKRKKMQKWTGRNRWMKAENMASKKTLMLNNKM